jgi:hypothetical protein
MDRHFIDAFIESLIDHVTDRVALRLGLRRPVKALERPSALARIDPHGRRQFIAASYEA